MPKLKTILLAPVVLFIIAYVVIAVLVVTDDNTAAAPATSPASLETIAIFGASGTAGDGILKSALANPDIKKIHVITRRTTARIDAGIKSGKVQMTNHMDYLNYVAIHSQIEKVDAVFWALGMSSVGVDEETYRRIHIDFPQQFLEEWISVSDRPGISFHYISSSDISEDSGAMWARVKFQAEQILFDLARDTNLRVIAYRPDYIGPTPEEAHIWQTFLYGFFAPIGVAVKATQIGQAMMEVTRRGDEFSNGDLLSTRRIVRYSDAFKYSDSSQNHRK
jgi:nucleoside-diphosphate-sugar epimerase